MAEFSQLEYVREGVKRVSKILHWGAFPVPVRARTIVGPDSDNGIALALSVYAVVAEIDAAAGVCRPVTVPIDDTCSIVA